MNAEAQLGDLGDFVADIEVEQEKEEKEKTICARLMFTKEQEKDMLDAFNLLDHVGDGKIDGLKFRVVVKALGYEPTKEELNRMVNAVDKGHTGKMSFENFQTAIQRKIMGMDSEMDIRKSFRLFDMDDAGFISVDNLKEVTNILGIYLTDEELEEMMDDADKDMDGLVSYEEFLKMIKSSVEIKTL